MKGTASTFSILITTKNRVNDLAITLGNIQYLLENKEVTCIICDDGSTDETSSFVKTHYPDIQLIQNSKSQGLIFSRNRLLNLTTSEFAISIDDDAHFISENPLESIRNYFEGNSNCGLLSLRIFWGLEKPISVLFNEKAHRVQSFVGCGHVWRMAAWHTIPNYPAWFIFYGEEDFASYQLFKKKWEVHYFPEVLINHRVDVKSRKNNPDYALRQRRSLRSGWYLFFMFYPIRAIPHIMSYSLWIQFKQKVFRGDLRALQAIILALLDLVWAIPLIVKHSNRLSRKEFQTYCELPRTKVYWSQGK
jgi:glycosyltransferase involved in cell wall biosynthesis